MWSRWNYRRRAEQDLARWQAAGWVTDGGATAIRADLARGGGGAGLAQSLSVLAAVLIGFAVMSFVGANWEDMSRIARLGLLIGSLWASYAGAGYLMTRGAPGFANSAVLLGTALFGASIMLISQMYHIDGNPPDAVLLWAAGTLLAGVVLRSNPALAFAMVLVGVWSGMETAQRGDVFWPFLAGWVVVSAAFYWQGWKPGVHLAGVALTIFAVSLGYLLNQGHAHPLVAVIGLTVAGAAIGGGQTHPRLGALWSGMLGYGIVIAFSGLWALQHFETQSTGDFMLLAVLTLALCLAAVWWGLTTGHRGALWLGYAGFSAEILGIYAEKLGTLINTSLFFLVAGLIVAALAYVAYRLHARGEAQHSSTPEPGT
jgi:uncharacterized membrane protein